MRTIFLMIFTAFFAALMVTIAAAFGVGVYETVKFLGIDGEGSKALGCFTGVVCFAAEIMSFFPLPMGRS